MSGGEIRIGIAGWVFEPWRGEFYPKGLVQKNELAYASSKLGVIEINSTFRAYQRPASFAKWAAETPEGFRFSVKGHQLITHILKLANPGQALANFFASGPLALGARLGPFVWQLPPSLKFDAARLEDFLALLPQTPKAASALAGKHDDRLKHGAHVETEGITTVRHAIEVRHESFRTPGFLDLLRRHNVALVTADTEDWPVMDLTADFAYARLQGPHGVDREGYNDADLDLWAKRIRAWSTGEAKREGELIAEPMDDEQPRDVFAFFVRTDKVHAPRNAQALMRKLGVAAQVAATAS
jgi:uncharacterized protein YecE (DUF72 family)